MKDLITFIKILISEDFNSLNETAMQVNYFYLPHLVTGIVTSSSNCVTLSRLTRTCFWSVHESRWRMKASICFPQNDQEEGELPKTKEEGRTTLQQGKSLSPTWPCFLYLSPSHHRTQSENSGTLPVLEDIVKCTAPLNPKRQKWLLYCINGLYVTLQFTGCSSPDFSSFVIPDSILRSFSSMLNL